MGYFVNLKGFDIIHIQELQSLGRVKVEDGPFSPAEYYRASDSNTYLFTIWVILHKKWLIKCTSVLDLAWEITNKNPVHQISSSYKCLCLSKRGLTSVNGESTYSHLLRWSNQDAVWQIGCASPRRWKTHKVCDVFPQYYGWGPYRFGGYSG